MAKAAIVAPREARWWLSSLWSSFALQDKDTTTTFKTRPVKERETESECVIQIENLINEFSEVRVKVAWAAFILDGTLYDEKTMYPVVRFIKNFDSFVAVADHELGRVEEYGRDHGGAAVDAVLKINSEREYVTRSR